MRKTLFIFNALVILSLTSYAQIEKGIVQLEGQLNLEVLDANDISETSFSLIPNLSIFLNDKTSLGFITGYSRVDGKYPVFNTTTAEIIRVKRHSNVFQIGIYARFYKKVGDNLYLYLQPVLTTEFGKTKNFYDDNKFKTSSLRVYISPGISYFLSPKIGMTASFGNLSYSRDKMDDMKRNHYKLNLSSSIGLGLSYYFR